MPRRNATILVSAIYDCLPDRVVLSQELSQARTQDVPFSLACASLAESPEATIRPPLSPCLTGKRPLWKATSKVCFLVKQRLA